MPTQEHTNRLIDEKSPYLLQHAHNPVDWYPWGDEAFEKSVKEDKPIFLSIGYSTCHWCHVMEEESFSNLEIAKILNDHFVAIKVDREERPDIDNIYMTAVQMMTGSGGWPLTAILTPERVPFFTGTYFPPDDRWGRPGLKKILLSVVDSWTHRRADVLKAGTMIHEALVKQSQTAPLYDGGFSPRFLEQATQDLMQRYDARYGGFSRAPKFPMGHSLSFLLRMSQRQEASPDILPGVTKTLREMYYGGIYDHLAGGFHRYSTDEAWRVPHFEKMLYDQALLVRAYVEAYQLTREETFAFVARDTIDYVLAQMTDDGGAFYSAQDADSVVDPAHPQEKGEGAFYVWTDDEITEFLGKDADVIRFIYGIEKHGNALEDPHREFVDKNILYRAKTIQEASEKFHISESEIQAILATARRTLYRLREQRIPPHLDDKIMTDWNGLMISSMAFAGRALKEPRYVEAAEKAAQFLLKHMLDGQRLWHRYRMGDAGINGTLEDYAFLVHGLLDLYEATLNLEYLKTSDMLSRHMITLFWDHGEGGFYMTEQETPYLLIRQKEIYDGAIPSGNSIAAHNMSRLARMTGQKIYQDHLEMLFEVFAARVELSPSAFCQFLMAFDFTHAPGREIVIAQGEDTTLPLQVLEELFSVFYPYRVILLRPNKDEGAKDLIDMAPFLREQVAIDGKTTIYICENYACQQPVTTLEDFRRFTRMIR